MLKGNGTQWRKLSPSFGSRYKNVLFLGTLLFESICLPIDSFIQSKCSTSCLVFIVKSKQSHLPSILISGKLKRWWSKLIFSSSLSFYQLLSFCKLLCLSIYLLFVLILLLLISSFLFNPLTCGRFYVPLTYEGGGLFYARP